MSYMSEIIKSATVSQLQCLLENGVQLTTDLVNEVAAYDAVYDFDTKLRWIYTNTAVRCSPDGITKALEAYYRSDKHERMDYILQLFVRYHDIADFKPDCYYNIVHQPWGAWVVNALLSYGIPFDQYTVNLAAFNGLPDMALRLLKLRPDLSVAEVILFARYSEDKYAARSIAGAYTYDGVTYTRKQTRKHVRKSPLRRRVVSPK